MRNLKKGFSLIELLVTIAVLAIISWLGMSVVKPLLDEYSLDNAVNTVLISLNEARETAMAKNRSVTIGFDNKNVFYDQDLLGTCATCKNETRSIESNDLTLKFLTFSTIIFKSNGTVNPVTITLKGQAGTRNIILNMIGRSYEN